MIEHINNLSDGAVFAIEWLCLTIAISGVFILGSEILKK